MGSNAELADKPFFLVFVLQVALTLAFSYQVKLVCLVPLSDLNLFGWTYFQSNFTCDVVFNALVAAKDNTPFKCKRENEPLDFFFEGGTDVQEERVYFTLLIKWYVNVV